MAASDPTVLVVDDDAGLRAAIQGLLRSAGLRSQSYASPQEFLRAPRPDGPACLVLDLQLPGLSGLEVQRALGEAGADLPTIFLTGHGDVPSSVRAMKAGAVEFLTKPFDDEQLLGAIRSALELDREAQEARLRYAEVRGRYACLTGREREVMAHVVAGLLNKQIAGVLGLSEITVKVHRGRLMRKMQAGSVAELVRLAGRLGQPEGPGGVTSPARPPPAG
jgi:FixJ family two-component response regulator